MSHPCFFCSFAPRGRGIHPFARSSASTICRAAVGFGFGMSASVNEPCAPWEEDSPRGYEKRSPAFWALDQLNLALRGVRLMILA
jgi:hypothetical protein